MTKGRRNRKTCNERQRRDLLGRNPRDRENDRHHEVRSLRRQPLVVKPPAPRRLVVGREHVAVPARTRIEIRRLGRPLRVNRPALLRELAAAVTLPVEAELDGALDRTLEPIVFLEVLLQENCSAVQIVRLFD